MRALTITALAVILISLPALASVSGGVSTDFDGAELQLSLYNIVLKKGLDLEEGFGLTRGFKAGFRLDLFKVLTRYYIEPSLFLTTDSGIEGVDFVAGTEFSVSYFDFRLELTASKSLNSQDSGWEVVPQLGFSLDIGELATDT